MIVYKVLFKTGTVDVYSVKQWKERMKSSMFRVCVSYFIRTTMSKKTFLKRCEG